MGGSGGVRGPWPGVPERPEIPEFGQNPQNRPKTPIFRKNPIFPDFRARDITFSGMLNTSEL